MLKLKNIIQKILISLIIFFIISSTIIPTISRADVINTSKEVIDSSVGGVLYEPIQQFVVGLGDAVIWIMQYIFTGNTSVTIPVTSSNWTAIDWEIPLDFRWDRDVNWGEVNRVTGEEKLNVPTIRISPESIFSGKIPSFDINFFKPAEDLNYSSGRYEYQNEYYFLKLNSDSSQKEISDSKKKIYNFLIEHNWKSKYSEYDEKTFMSNSDVWTHENQITADCNGGRGNFVWEEEDKDGIKTYSAKYWVLGHPGNGMMGYDVDIYISKADRVWVELNSGHKTSSARILQPTVSYWYNILRNVSIIGLLSVLVYIGIRIVISSTATDKSKYKEMLKDWLVALCLLFFMHYFMNFIVTITSSISSMLVDSGNVTVNEAGQEVTDHVDPITGAHFMGDELVGLARINLQTGGTLNQMACTVIYAVLVIYTLIFALMYLKRVLYMAFFTMMAPLVALTYPLDKIRDGKAQGFDMWLKEYTFNALLQPFHLILYYVLVSSSLSLAKENMIYSLVAIGFIMPAERLLRKFFGMDKAETAGVLGGALGGAMIMQGINALTSKGKGGTKGKSSTGGKGETPKKSIRTADAGYGRDALLSGLIGTSGGSNPRGVNPGSSNPGVGSRRTISNNISSSTRNHPIRGVASVAEKYGYKGVKGGARLIAKGITAGTLGTIGLAAGLASDDYSNVLKWGAAGAVGGSMLADSAINKASQIPENVKGTLEDIRDEYEENAYSPEKLQQIQNERADREFLKDKETQKLYKQAFGSDNYQQAMLNALEYRKNGVTDDNMIVKAMKLDDAIYPSDNQRISAAMLAEGVSSEKDIEEREKRLKAVGIDDNIINDQIKMIRKLSGLV